MSKATTAAFLVTATVVAGALLASEGPAAPSPATGGLAHTIRAFGYELSLGVHLSRVRDAPGSGGPAAISCPPRVDTVFVLLLPTDPRTERGS